MIDRAAPTFPRVFLDEGPVPSRIGRFTIVSVIGSGGMGRVYGAQDDAWGTAVALKTLAVAGTLDPASIRTEFRATARLRHPNLVRLYELGRHEGNWFFTMEWIHGTALEELRGREGAIAAVFAQLASVVHALHEEGLLHLDIKPANIVLRGATPVLLDFGIARLRASLDQAGAFSIGTPGFIAPERLDGRVDEGADWYALGITLGRILGEGAARSALSQLAARWSHPDPRKRGGWPDAVELLGAQPSPLESRLRDSLPTMAQRRVESAHLAAAWRDLDGPRMVWLRGRSGCGKAWLAGDFANQRVREGAADAVTVRCRTREPAEMRATDALIEALGMPSRPTEATTLDPWARWAGLARAESQIEAMHVALVNRLVKRAAARPLVLVFEDVQWADANSGRLLGAVLASLRRTPILVIVTATPPRAGEPIPPFLAELTAEVPTREVDVPPLATAQATHWLLEAGMVSDPETAERLAHRCEGLPFLLAQGERTVATIVRELGDDELRLLRTVAAAGMPVPLVTAVRATGQLASPQEVITRLESRGLVLIDGLFPGDAIECRHELIATEVLATLPSVERCSIHRELARHATGDATALFLAHQLRGAGADAEAARRARLGAIAAEAAGSFEIASRLWAVAHESAPEPEDAERRTRALLAIGHRAAAADVLLSGQPTEAAVIAAGGHLLAAGAVDRGMRTLEPVLRRVGLVVPTSSASATWRALVALLDIAYSERWARPRSGAEGRASVSWMLARGLLATDAFVGMYFALVGYAWSLRGEDQSLSSRLGAVVGSVILGPLGGPFARWGGSMLQRASRHADGDDLLRGVVAVGRAQAALLDGDWLRTLEAADEAGALLNRGSDDTSWEMDIAELGAIRALEELGRSDDALRRAARLRHLGRQRGTLYTEVTGLLYEATNLLPAGELDAARHLCEQFRRLWPFKGFHMQHAYAMRIEATVALYEGDVGKAYELVESSWGAVKGSGLMQIPMVSFDMWELRARCALAVGRSDAAEGMLQQLQRRGKPYAGAWARAVAAVCLGRGSASEAAGRLRELGLVARGAWVDLACGVAVDPGQTRGVLDPARWTAVQLPRKKLA